MKNLFFRSLLLLSCLVAAQNLNAQRPQISPTDSSCFDMEIEKVSSTDNIECFRITVTVYDPQPRETIFVTDGDSSVGFSDTQSFIWCYNKPLNAPPIEFLIECFMQTNTGEHCRDGCIITIDP